MKESKINIDDILAEVEELKSNKWITNKKNLPEGADVVLWECFKDIGKPGHGWVSYQEAIDLLKRKFNFEVSQSTLRRIYKEKVEPKFKDANRKSSTETNGRK